MGSEPKCPYCGSTELLPPADAASGPIELACAKCGGRGEDLLPLAEAADLAVRRISRVSADGIGTESEQLDRAAIALAVHVPIYTMDGWGRLRRIDQEALVAGRFRGGGKRLAFDDERAPITALVVMKDEALKAIDGLATLHIARALKAGASRSRDGEDGRYVKAGILPA
jgi:hypothetical protein